MEFAWRPVCSLTVRNTQRWSRLFQSRSFPCCAPLWEPGKSCHGDVCSQLHDLGALARHKCKQVLNVQILPHSAIFHLCSTFFVLSSLVLSSSLLYPCCLSHVLLCFSSLWCVQLVYSPLFEVFTLCLFSFLSVFPSLYFTSLLQLCLFHYSFLLSFQLCSFFPSFFPLLLPHQTYVDTFCLSAMLTQIKTCSHVDQYSIVISQSVHHLLLSIFKWTSMILASNFHSLDHLHRKCLSDD